MCSSNRIWVRFEDEDGLSDGSSDPTAEQSCTVSRLPMAEEDGGCEDLVNMAISARAAKTKTTHVGKFSNIISESSRKQKYAHEKYSNMPSQTGKSRKYIFGKPCTFATTLPKV